MIDFDNDGNRFTEYDDDGYHNDWLVSLESFA